MRALDCAILALFVLAIVAFAADRLGKALDNSFAASAARIEQGAKR